MNVRTMIVSFAGAACLAALWVACLSNAGATSFAGSRTSVEEDIKTVAMLDTKFQAATKVHDVAAISNALPDDYILVVGNGKVYTKSDLVKQAETKEIRFEHQEEINQSQTVRVWGNTAVVTALLWVKYSFEKGENKGKVVDKKLWFSDTYARTPNGWRYVFGQSSIALPEAP